MNPTPNTFTLTAVIGRCPLSSRLPASPVLSDRHDRGGRHRRRSEQVDLSTDASSCGQPVHSLRDYAKKLSSWRSWSEETGLVGDA